MTATDTIGRIESDAYRSRWRDGTLDAFGGAGVLLVGVSWWLGLFWLPAAMVPVLVVAWASVRRRLVEPRIGRVTFGRERRESAASGMVGAVWLGGGFLGLALVAVLYTRGTGADPIREWGSAIPVALLGVMALVTAALTRQLRFAGYALVLGLAGVAGVVFELDPVVQMLIGGVVITLAGVLRVGRFLSVRPAVGEGVAE